VRVNSDGDAGCLFLEIYEREKVMSIPNWSNQCSQSELQHISILANDYALAHSLIIRPKLHSTTSPKAADPAPFTLLPSHFPKKLFERAQNVQEAYNALYANVAIDKEFLKKVIGGAVIKVDEFQRGLWEVYERVEREGVRQVRET
jgi:glutathione synthase